jgi:hypothetical protein
MLGHGSGLLTRVGQNSVCGLGDKAAAIRLLQASVESGFFPYPYFVTDPLPDNLRDLPESPHAMDIARKRHAAFKKEFS